MATLDLGTLPKYFSIHQASLSVGHHSKPFREAEVMHFSRGPIRDAPAVRHGDHEKRPEAAL